MTNHPGQRPGWRSHRTATEPEIKLHQKHLRNKKEGAARNGGSLGQICAGQITSWVLLTGSEYVLLTVAEPCLESQCLNHTENGKVFFQGRFKEDLQSLPMIHVHCI